MSEDCGSDDAPADDAPDADAPDAETSSLPTCPRCGDPVISVTTRGPTDHVAAPCGCRVAPPDR